MNISFICNACGDEDIPCILTIEDDSDYYPTICPFSANEFDAPAEWRATDDR